MNQPRISIIVPVYNVERYITECLQSVMRQNYQGPMECIVVDDCGTDKSVEIAERLIAEYDGPIDFIVLHHEKNLGISCARNTGMDVAQGDYVFFLDSDDWISDDCIDYLVSLANTGNYDMVVGGHANFYGENDERNSLSKDDTVVVQEVSGRQFLYDWRNGGLGSIAVWNKLYPIWNLRKTKVCFNKDVSFAEDVLFNFELFHLPTTICRSNKVTYYYRQQREGSILFESRRQGASTVMMEKRVSSWLALRRVRGDGFDDLHELCLHRSGFALFNVAKNSGFPFYHIFRLLHQEYPYSPLRLWLHKEKDFHWYKTRMTWSLPTFLGFVWFQVKWWKNHVGSK